MPPLPLRLTGLVVSASLLAAAELAPSADLGSAPELAPRTWFMFNFAPDDQAVAAQTPRRREVVIGTSRTIDQALGLNIHVEGVWSPVRAPRGVPPARVDELLGGIGASLERPGDAFGWRLALTAGLRALTDLGTAELDRAENRIFRGTPYHSEGAAENPGTVDALLAARASALIRVTDSDPLRQKPIDLALGARATQVLPADGEGNGDTDLRLSAVLLLPSRITLSWFGLTWQRLGQPVGGSRALETVNGDESAWWFTSGGALRLGGRGDWLIELGSALDLHSGVTVGTLGVVRSGDPPRAGTAGTSSLELVVLRAEHTAAGIAAGDKLTVLGPLELRSEIRTLVGDRSQPEGAVSADSLRLDGLLRLRLPYKLTPVVAFGPEVGLGLGLRRDAVQFTSQEFAAVNRFEATGDLSLAGQVATGWQGGIAALGCSLGWAWWQALDGGDELSANGLAIPLDRSGGGMIVRFGLQASF